MDSPSVLISILNWNNADDTLRCIASLESETKGRSFRADIRVVDNGSEEMDYGKLCGGALSTQINIARLDNNLGFTGGHNTAIKSASDAGYKYIWLLNNDATVEPGCLDKLVDAMERDEGLGAVSPVILPKGGGQPIAAWGGIHKWTSRETVWFLSEAEYADMHKQRPNEVFVAGTAILLRVAALRQIGGLDDRLFAYYDDSDIGVRLAESEWRSEVVFNAIVEHEWRTFEQLPNYFFYLMFRNEMIFWYTHMPAEHRRFLWLKLVNDAIYKSVRLSLRNVQSRSDAALLGVWDFMLSNHGRPNLNRKIPLILRGMCVLSKIMHRSRLIEFQKNLQVGTPTTK